MKKAFITGISGQDGAYLAQVLLENNYKVYGGVRRTSTEHFWRLERLNIFDHVELIDFELLEQSNIFNTIERLAPDEIYNLGAQSFVGVSFKQPVYTGHVSGIGALYILETIKNILPKTKFYQASTSELFGKVKSIPQNETTPFHPRSPYGVAKLFAHWSTINYRESYNLFASTGILFNHESPLRGEEFVTRKVTKGLVEVKKGKRKKLILGNLDARRDWGYAKDFCEGIYRILQADKPDDFVLCTGVNYSIKEFVEKVCQFLDLQIIWKGSGISMQGYNGENSKTIVEVSKEFFRPNEVDHLLGDYTKAKKELNWQPETNFEKLVEIMVEEELKYFIDKNK